MSDKPKAKTFTDLVKEASEIFDKNAGNLPYEWKIKKNNNADIDVIYNDDIIDSSEEYYAFPSDNKTMPQGYVSTEQPEIYPIGGIDPYQTGSSIGITSRRGQKVKPIKIDPYAFKIASLDRNFYLIRSTKTGVYVIIDDLKRHAASFTNLTNYNVDLKSLNLNIPSYDYNVAIYGNSPTKTKASELVQILINNISNGQYSSKTKEEISDNELLSKLSEVKVYLQKSMSNVGLLIEHNKNGITAKLAYQFDYSHNSSYYIIKVDNKYSLATLRENDNKSFFINKPNYFNEFFNMFNGKFIDYSEQTGRVNINVDGEVLMVHSYQIDYTFNEKFREFLNKYDFLSLDKYYDGKNIKYYDDRKLIKTAIIVDGHIVHSPNLCKILTSDNQEVIIKKKSII